jgi:hypothetical protein
VREVLPEVVEAGRERKDPRFASKTGERMGAFRLRYPSSMKEMQVIISDGSDWAALGLPGPAWEHVSVSLKDRCPTWEEMAWVKSLFFGDEECVIQFHPPRSRYVNRHRFCLHLWRPVGVEMPMPPLECV